MLPVCAKLLPDLAHGSASPWRRGKKPGRKRARERPLHRDGWARTISPVNSQQLEQATGFTTLPAARAHVWHWNVDCAGLQLSQPRTIIKSANVLDLAGEQALLGRWPCRRVGCSYPVILDALEQKPAGPGYHYVACANPHSKTNICIRCITLGRYAKTRNLLVATPGGRISILRPGTINGTISDLFGLGMAGHNAPGEHLPEMSAATWAVAATLVGPRVRLTQALQAAASVHAPPTA